jgi:hypothetical protein
MPAYRAFPHIQGAPCVDGEGKAAGAESVAAVHNRVRRQNATTDTAFSWFHARFL